MIFSTTFEIQEACGSFRVFIFDQALATSLGDSSSIFVR